jgi:hypothetical protein
MPARRDKTSQYLVIARVYKMLLEGEVLYIDARFPYCSGVISG